MTIPRLASPTFVAGPLDALKAVDVYDINNNESLNDITSVLDALDTTALKNMLPKFNGGMLETATNALGSALSMKSQLDAKAKGLEPQALMQKARALSPDLTTALDTAGPGIKDSVLSTIKQFEISPAITNNITSAFNDTSLDRLIQQNSVNNFVSNIVNSASRNQLNLGNQKMTALILGGIIHQGNRFGMDGLVENVLSAVDDELTRNLISGLVISSISRSGWLDDLLGLADRTSYGYLRTTYPLTIPNFVSTYKAKYAADGTRNLLGELTSIETTFNKLDVNWFVERVTPNKTVQSFKLLTSASRDFIDVMRFASYTFPNNPQFPLRGNMYHLSNLPKTNPEALLQQEFPTLVIK